MATIRERKNANGSTMWHVQVRLKGHPTETASFARKTDAKRWAAQTETAIREGRYFPSSESKRHTVADLIDRYTETVLPSKKSARSQVAQFAWWHNELGVLTLKDLTPARLSEARDKLAAGVTRKGTKRTPATVVRYMAAFQHALNVAVKEWQWLTSNPMEQVRKPREPRGRDRFLDADELKRLLAACDQGPDWLRPLVTLAVSTGMRQGELLGMRWPEIDLAAKRFVARRTKNNEVRSVALARPAVAALKAWSKVRRLDDDRVFPDVSSLSHRWADAVERAGLKDFRFHDLRHTAASNLAMNGATLSEIAGVLGHKTLAMVKRYAHLSESHLAHVVERMNPSVFGKQ